MIGDSGQGTGKRAHHTGFFLTIEGVEGAGKSTLALEIQKHLTAEGREAIVTAEPGGDPVAKKIRKLLLDSANRISDRAELLLFEAARAQHVDAVILPALRRGCVVICDRFADSSIAYQGYARGLDVDTVRALNHHATGGLRPDLTILLDVAPKVGLARQRGVDRVSSEQLTFHESVRKGYLALAEAEPERFAVIDASMGFEEVTQTALEVISSRLPAACT